jgi:SAM-dependent methyltransferase
MVETIPFEPRRFQAAARHYYARPLYSPKIFERVAEICGLTQDDRIMDLGSGPGILSLALAPWVGSVVAVDPEPNMLAALEEHPGAFADKITMIEGSSNDLGPHFGTFKLVVMGRSFHWMDRVETVKRFDEIIEPGGAVVIFDTSAVRGADNRWGVEYRKLLKGYAAPNGPTPWHQPDWIDQEAVLLDSAFGSLERHSVFERRRIPAEGLIDRAFSMSSTNAAVLGPEKTEALARDIHALIAEFAVDGMLTEILETSALIARRPG